MDWLSTAQYSLKAQSWPKTNNFIYTDKILLELTPWHKLQKQHNAKVPYSNKNWFTTLWHGLCLTKVAGAEKNVAYVRLGI